MSANKFKIGDLVWTYGSNGKIVGYVTHTEKEGIRVWVTFLNKESPTPPKLYASNHLEYVNNV